MKWNGTDEQRANLTKLADHLSKLPRDCDHFDMGNFASNPQIDLLPEDSLTPFRVYESRHECGTTACAAGYGPLIGIEAKANESWGGYIRRVFGVEITGDIDFYNYLFDQRWPNDPKAAANRIRKTLEGKVDSSEIKYRMSEMLYVHEF